MFCRERRLGPREAADLDASRRVKLAGEAGRSLAFALQALLQQFFLGVDRKSTRLNSSHSSISYAVFCLKKKKKGGRQRSARSGPRATPAPVETRDHNWH